MAELQRRNRERLAKGGFSDVSHWFESQLENYAELASEGLIDVVLDGTSATAELANEITLLASRGA